MTLDTTTTASRRESRSDFRASLGQLCQGLVGAWYAPGDTSISGQRLATYAYDGLPALDAAVSGQGFRRTKKIVANQGTGIVRKSDSGGITGIQALDMPRLALRADSKRESRALPVAASQGTEEFYYSGWSIAETRDGSGNTLYQMVRSVEYIDSFVRMDRNTNPGGDNDCLNASSAAYYYHQDANFRVVALTDEDGGVVERYESRPRRRRLPQ
jgi:hypothetical protein